MGSTDPSKPTLEDDGRDQFGSLFGTAFGGKDAPQPQKAPDTEIVVECSLEEFYNGSNKILKYTQELISHDGKTTHRKDVTKTLTVKPGYGVDTILRFSKEGNQAFRQIQADLVVKFKQISHSNFHRSGDNLIYTHDISLQDALLSTPFTIKALDGRSLPLVVDEIISPATVRQINGEGMPINRTLANLDKPIELMNVREMPKGNLYVKFNVIFPAQID